MTRYIDADKLTQDLGEEPLNWTDSDTEMQEQADYKLFKNLIESQPTADVVEAKHGEWKWNEYGQMYCSWCELYPELAIEKPYCPNCGAKMDGKALKEREKE